MRSMHELIDREHHLGDVPQGRQSLQVIEYREPGIFGLLFFAAILQ